MKIFDQTYASGGGFWNRAPSNPTPFTLFDGNSTYSRPGIAYIALRQILGAANFTQALQQLQRKYGGSSITEPQLEAAFHQQMPNQSAACNARLTLFFHEWFDTSYRSGAANKPRITGPGLSGPGFYTSGGDCV